MRLMDVSGMASASDRGIIVETLDEMLKRHEGRSPIPYRDSVGVWTVGYGHNMGKPLSEAALQQIFADDLREAQHEVVQAFPWYADLTQPRQWVLVDMCFNLGLTRLQGFKKFLAAMERGDYETARTEMLDSVWRTQVKGRAVELANLIYGPEQV